REPLRGTCVLALGYSACVGYLVALAASNLMARSSTKLLGKRPCGLLHPLSWLLLLPYHLGLRVKLAAQRLVSSEPLYNRVLPGWYIGGWPWAGPSELPPDCPSVLDCTCELPRTHRNRYMCLATWDTQAPSASQVDRGVAFALSERSLGRPVYVHCAHGHGRSALLLIACLLEAGAVGSCEEGLALLQAVRPRVRLNGRQRRALEAWARSRGKGALQMQALGAAGVVAGETVGAVAGGLGGDAGAAVLACGESGGGSLGVLLERRSTGGGVGVLGGAGVHVVAEAGSGGGVKVN
ncbi:hypothetical protein Agub_g15150, partial [Astrephomene gubernaculifera]